MPGGCDILIVYSPDAGEWCQYLQELFLSSRQIRRQKMLTHRLAPETCFSAEDLSLFLGARCIVVLLSAELVMQLRRPALQPPLQRAFQPAHRVVRLLCGVQDSPEFLNYFPDWALWQELTCDDEPETYVAAVTKALSEGESLFCSQDWRNPRRSHCSGTRQVSWELQSVMLQDKQGLNALVVQCGACGYTAE